MPDSPVVSAVPALLSCEDCGLRLLGFRSRGPTPISHDECPRCGGDAFFFEEERDADGG